MSEIELWKETGRRALRIAEQRGLTRWNAGWGVISGGALLGMVLASGHHAVHPAWHGSMALRMERGGFVRQAPFGQLPSRPLAPSARESARVEAERAHLEELRARLAVRETQAERALAAQKAQLEAERARIDAALAALDAQAPSPPRAPASPVPASPGSASSPEM